MTGAAPAIQRKKRPSPSAARRTFASWLPGIALMSLLLLAGNAATARSAELVMLYFMRKDCSWCIQLDKVLAEPAVANLLRDQVQLVKVDLATVPVEDGLAPNDGRLAVPPAGADGHSWPRACPLAGSDQQKRALLVIDRTPTLLLLTTGGRILLRVPGLLPANDLRAAICDAAPALKGCSPRFPPSP